MDVTRAYREDCAVSDELGLIDRYRRAANYLSVGQIYLLDNPLLREPLRPEDVKPRLLGHWGHNAGPEPDLRAHEPGDPLWDLNAIFVTGPGHGGPGLVANAYLKGTYTEVYPTSREMSTACACCSGSSRSPAASRATSLPRYPDPSTRAASSGTHLHMRTARFSCTFPHCPPHRAHRGRTGPLVDRRGYRECGGGLPSVSVGAGSHAHHDPDKLLALDAPMHHVRRPRRRVDPVPRRVRRSLPARPAARLSREGARPCFRVSRSRVRSAARDPWSAPRMCGQPRRPAN